MTGQLFGATYAAHYDQVYAGKAYLDECHLLESAFERYGNGAVESILDLGCGTGTHAWELAHRGYRVTGVDRSQEMLEQARQKQHRQTNGTEHPRPEFVHGDARHLDLGKTFDAALMMFVVLGYQLENEDVLAAFQSVRRHLEPGGLFICDVWYGPAVLTHRPTTQVKQFDVPEGKLIRISSTRLDTARQTATVEIQTKTLGAPLESAEMTEIHEVRYFFPRELAFFLASAQLQLVSLTAFPDLDRQPDEDTWNALAVCRAV